MRTASHAWPSRFAEAAILAVVYYVAAKAGLRLAFLNPSATPIWPPTGIAIAALLLTGTRAWPGILAGAFAANLTTEGTVWTSLGIAAGNTLEAAVAAALVGRYAGGRRAFNRIEDIVRFAAFAAVLSTAISATAGVTTLASAGFVPWRMYGPVWLTWWLGDATSAVVVTPALLLWIEEARRGWTVRGVVERLVFVAVLLVASVTVFGTRYPFSFAIVPLLIWAAFRFGARDAATVVVFVSAAAIAGTLRRVGPFALAGDPNIALLYLSLFMAMMSIVVLTVARIVDDRAAAAEELHRRVRAEADARRTAERAVAHANRLAAVAAALSQAVGPEDVAAVIVDQAVDTLRARAAAISLFADDGIQMELVHAKGYPAEIIQRWRRFQPAQFGGVAECLRTGRVIWMATEDDLAKRYPEREELPPGIRGGARAALPLIAHGAAVGCLYLNFGAPRPFEPDEITFLTTLGHQCAQAVERARLYAREHHAAETFQRALLPVAIPEVPGIAIHTVYRPGAREANVGGDWYDVFRLPSGNVVISVGDVAGRGLSAAVVMGELRQTIRTAALEHGDPAAVLRQASEALVLAHGRDAMATAIVALLDPVSSVLTYATAGHPAPVLAAPGADPVVLPAAGVPLGYLSAAQAPSWSVSLPAGALLILYTDGLIEHRRDIAAGQEALVEAARREIEAPGDDPALGILGRVLGDGRSSDDVAIIALAVDREPLNRFELALPAEPESAAVIRQTVRRLAQVAALDHAPAAALAVAVGEAVNNAIEHAYRVAGGSVHVKGVRDDAAVHVTVTDTGTWRPAPPSDGGGHGLRLIEQLVDAVQIRPTPSGTTVAITMRLSRPAAPPTAVVHAEGGSGSETGRPPRNVGVVIAQAAERPSGPAGARLDTRDGGAIVELYGDLDATVAEVVRAALARAARAAASVVLVSLERADYIDSLTIRELFAFGRDLATRRRSLALIIPPGSPLERVLTIAGLTRPYRVFASAADARRALKEVTAGG